MKKSIFRRRRSRIRREGKDGFDFVEKILDDNLSIESLKYDKTFWKLITSNPVFRRTIIEAMLSRNDGEHIGDFFGMIFIKTVEKELTNDFQQMIYFEE